MLPLIHYPDAIRPIAEKKGGVISMLLAGISTIHESRDCRSLFQRARFDDMLALSPSRRDRNLAVVLDEGDALMGSDQFGSL
jgi:hypothetical protein